MAISIEQIAIAKLIDERNITPFLDASIGADFFAQERWNKAWTWTHEYWATHGEVPKLAVFKREYPSLDLDVDIDEPMSAIVDELIERRRKFIVQDGIQEAATAYDNDDIKGTITIVQKMLSQVSIETSKSMIESSSDFVGSAIQAAVNRKNMEMTGVPTGFPTMDDMLGGLQPEQFIVILGNPKAGKSTIALQMAISAQLAGFSSKYITFEMANDELKWRYLSLGANVSLNHILRGHLSKDDIVALRRFEERVMDLPPLILIHDLDSVMTVGGIAAKHEQHPTDLIVIDGMYLMEDELGEDKGSSQALTNITRTTKRFCQRARIPIIGTTQALISKTGKRAGVQVGSAGYSSSFGQDADAVFGLDRPDNTTPTAKLKLLASRSSLGIEVDLLFDYERGRCEESGGYNPLQFEKVGHAQDDDS